MKRSFDIILSSFGLIVTGPILALTCFFIWLTDFRSPFYFAPRVGKNEKIFTMIKLRSMKINADKSRVDSTAGDDPRITTVGKFVRKFKLDEVTQLINVLKGDMSLVGPRPNVQREVALYTDEEKKLLSVRPGITDFASIVFADEGEILQGKPDPDIAYNQLIRPWKSRLSLFGIGHRSFMLDLKLIYLTAVAVVSRSWALKGVQDLLRQLGADEQLIRIAARDDQLRPSPPPGAAEVVTGR